MLKHHNLISFGLGLAFLIILQRFATPEPIFRFLVPAFLFIAAVIVFYDRWYLKQIGRYNVWVLMRPLLLLFSLFGIFLVIPTDAIRGLFLIASVLAITIFQILLPNQAENVLLNETLLIAFGLFFSFFAAYHYFPSYGPWYLVGVFVGATLLARAFYEFLPKSETVKFFNAAILGFFSCQLFWSLIFLPFHFSALSLLLFNVFYFCLILNYYHLFHILNLKKIQFHLALIVACNFLVLLATPWRVLK
jgi:hypothetical protein